MAGDSPRPLPLAPPPAGPLSLAEAPRGRPWLLKRPADADEATCSDQEGGSRSSRVKLRSLGMFAADVTPAAIEFHNRSSHAVRMIWLDHAGDEVPYTALQPGEVKLYRTYALHAWMARELGNERRCCIDGAQAVCAEADADDAPPRQAVITDAPLLRWEPALHWAFPARFREQARVLLLCWQRLAFGGGGSGGGGSGGGDSGTAAAASSSGSGDVEMVDAEEGPAADLGSLPAELLCHIIGLAAPDGLWQDGDTAHPDIRPVQVPAAAAFDRLIRKTRKVTGGRLPPPSRLSADLVLPQARS